ncbi:similar to Saccharomyces cerevisiae YDL157C Putative protein of unknown function [Maudiozyma saulgeensis]|uniref:DUF4536 domain-containing protein n=1 Tax=Maudiozyma saulgeensis TaxID=1789683 RepID=A0A1X7QYK8_9SACH|nr:similar to Saccharomyces cerevisiae YDL157C Putative protein of unknown function [Kazachstania saulgeensis]
MSNIANVFNPQQESKPIEDCLSCDIFNSIFLLGTGGYLVSGKAIIKDKKVSLKNFNEKNPVWWRNSIRGFGGFLVAYGIYRSFDTYESWKTSQEKKLTN